MCAAAPCLGAPTLPPRRRSRPFPAAVLTRAPLVQMFQLAEQRLTQLMMGDKSERAQKVFALDYCASAFVTEGAPAAPWERSRARARAAGMPLRGHAGPRRAGAAAQCSQRTRPLGEVSVSAVVSDSWLCPGADLCLAGVPWVCVVSCAGAGEVKYCIAKLFSNDVKFANITDY